MEDVTVGQIASEIALIAGIIGGLGVVTKLAGRAASKWLSERLEPISSKLDSIDVRLDDFDRDRCKDYLVHFIGRVDRGDDPSETEIERFYENYDRYTSLGGNSYVKTEVTRLTKAGKLRRD